MYYLYKSIFYLLTWVGYIIMIPAVPLGYISNFLCDLGSKVRKYAILRYPEKYQNDAKMAYINERKSM